VYAEVMFRRAGDDVLGCDDAGLAGLEEPAMNLSRKCCSQSEDGIVVRLGCIMLWYVCVWIVFGCWDDWLDNMVFGLIDFED